ncbi:MULTISPECIES: uracil phosphoribosyltransferase [unclassified Synechococcus]|uniref:uracil phosphoribosyltransferase n=1 Tax=unclassified Synechococcus TaxID=2626047 RepID=UPI0023B700D0|nr:MAG: Uracil phosphoribosyltransferase [Cyanobium sp. ARS6]|tara:strand:- start:722 stop:1339 length:618 start_codon:yes stop_codon:yes gene_type:complete
MAKTLRVVVPPHPLIAHWLTVLRHEGTPPALFRTAMEELGRWLSYEAMRDWLPHRRDVVKTPLGSAEGTVIETGVPLLAVPMIPGGLHLWEGARQVLPSAELCLGGLPEAIEAKAGVVLLLDQIRHGDELIELLRRLEQLKVEPPRLRVITALTASPGLKRIGECYPEISIHTACIDADLDERDRILPGIGDPLQRLGIRTAQPN